MFGIDDLQLLNDSLINNHSLTFIELTYTYINNELVSLKDILKNNLSLKELNTRSNKK